MPAPTDPCRRLTLLHTELRACTACPSMIGPVVHGPANPSRVMLIGQAPGPREGELGRPFAWTAGRTLFRWFEAATGVDEASFRAGVYISAVARCFPGKAPGGGDRRPDREEIGRCQRFLSREVQLLRPHLIVPVGGLAIEQVLGHKGLLVDVIGVQRRVRYHDVDTDVICLPHPCGVSTWHRVEPGITLLARALDLIARHPIFVAMADAARSEASASAASPARTPKTAGKS